MSWRFWLPGLRLKRYLALVALGFLVLGLDIGYAQFTFQRLYPIWIRHTPLVVWGLAIAGSMGVLVGTVKLWGSVTEALGIERWAGLVVSRRQLNRGPRIVALGGGTGLPAVLRGLKQYTANLTAVVTVADDGGSSGRLRGDLGMLPPGDIRNCMVSLADTEPLMEQLFQFRFQSGELKGHSFGNLFLAAMEQTSGDFVTALRESSRVLAVRGTVLPATLDHVVLKAELQDGTQLTGESLIGKSPQPISRVWLEPADATPLAEAIQAIDNADMIILGPGSLYTSVLPNLLIGPIADAIRHSNAIRVYVANIMTEPGETGNFTVMDHVRALEHHVGKGLIDIVIVNNQEIPEDLLRRYAHQGSEPVHFNLSDRTGAYVVLEGTMISIDGVVRHDPEKLARVLLKILVQYRPKWAEGRLLDALLLETKLRERRGDKWDGHTPSTSNPN